MDTEPSEYPRMDYNPKYKINIHELLRAEQLNTYEGNNWKIFCVEEFQIHYIDSPPCM
jgi:hypothetical protein